MYFYGSLVQNEELVKTARLRKKPYHEATVSKAEQADYLAQGWTVEKELKARVRLHQDKKLSELLEDEVWLLFWKMGFTEMNKDRNFKIQAGALQKQIDVFAKDGNDVFVVECKSSTGGANVSRQDIHELANLKKDIIDSIKKESGKTNLRISFVMATQNIKWNKTDEALAKDNEIFVFEEDKLKVFDGLFQHLGVSAKFTIYSILFRGKKIPELKKIKVPAILGGRGKEKYYSFLIEPEKLLQVAYVHRRESGLGEILDSYQRMVAKPRLRRINNFISKGGYFANNIILSFREKPTFLRFEKEKQAGDIVFGILEFPPSYASAWIIDGQHRLYGYANNEKRSREVIPVLAFESLNVKDQAKLFVDINREQKAVKPNLLWDLYPYIYSESEEEEHQIERAISLIVKRLNSDNDSPLRDHISIPSMLSKGKGITNLTMTTVCDAVEENGLINKCQMLLYKDDYDSTVDFACQRLKVYFNVIAESFLEDWERGDRGLLRSNIGIRILFIILRQFLLYLRHVGQEQIYTKKDVRNFKRETERVLSPMLSHLKQMSVDERSAIRKATAKGLVMRNAQHMVLKIREVFPEFGSDLLKKPIPSGETDETISKLLEDTEIKLRAVIAKELEKLHGAMWWKLGIPKDIRAYVHDRIEDHLKKAPKLKDHLRFLPPDKLLEYTTTGQLTAIIKDPTNWERFQQIFSIDKELTSVQFKFFETLRHSYAHHRPCDDTTKGLGYLGMKWLRECIGLEN